MRIRLPVDHRYNNMPWEYVRAKSQLRPPAVTPMAKALYETFIKGEDWKLEFNAKSFAKTKKSRPSDDHHEVA